MLKMFAIFGDPTDSLFGILKSSFVSSVTVAANIALVTWMNPGSFIWLYIVPPDSIKWWNKLWSLRRANFQLILSLPDYKLRHCTLN